MGNQYFNLYQKQDEPLNSGFYKIILYISFLWVSLYPTESFVLEYFYFNDGKLFDFTSNNFFYEVVIVFLQALVLFLLFEFIFLLYRSILKQKIYFFVVPFERFKADSRLYYALRNLLYGIILNLCFIFPYLYIYSIFFDMLITLGVFMIYLRHIYKNYSESIVSHFVFETFAFPIFFFEAVNVIFYIWRWWL